MKTTKNLASIILVTLFLGAFTQKASAHCEIPCGIYGDSIRISLLYEHFETIEKSMNQINELSKEKSVNYNQMVRWVMNKEDHASKIQEIVSQYFLHQRIKVKDPSDSKAYGKYIEQLTLLHQVLVFSMKAKQGTDLENVKKLRKLLHKFEHAYFGDH